MKKRFWWYCSSMRMSLVLCYLVGGWLNADSLWREESSQAMLSDRRAHRVGDILTILVQESNRATKDNSTETSKKSGVDAGVQAFLYAPTSKLPSMKLNSAQTFAGGGKINNSEQITTRIAVRVVDVLPNGNLVIEGTRHITFAGESQDATLQGVIRAMDVAANNTVFSFNIADAKIKYSSKGSVTDSQRKGWFTKIWGKVSPF